MAGRPPPDTAVNGVRTPETMSVADYETRSSTPYQQVPPQGTIEQRERTLRDERQAFEDHKLRMEVQYKRREDAHAESRRELEITRQEIRIMQNDLNGEKRRGGEELERDKRDWQAQKEVEMQEMENMQRMSNQKMEADWNAFEEKKAAGMIALEQKQKAWEVQRKKIDEMAATKEPSEDQVKLQELTAQVTELQKTKDELQLILENAQARIVELEALLLRSSVAQRSEVNEPEIANEETERKIPANEEVDGSAVAKPLGQVPPRVAPPPEPEEESKILVMPSSASGKFPFSSTTEEFINMLQDNTGCKYELQVKSGENISEDDVVALPFSGSGPLRLSALERAMKEANIKYTQRVIALGICTTSRTRSQAWQFTNHNEIPVVYVSIHGHGQLVQDENASAICKRVGSKLEGYYNAENN